MKNAADIWNVVLRVMKENLKVSQTTLNTWFDDIEAVEFSDNTLLLLSSAAFKRDTILRNYSKILTDALFEVFSVPVEFKLLTQDEYKRDKNSPSKALPIDFEYSFEKFIVGNSNKFAHAAAKAVAEEPGVTYNPLLIHGESGLGKTHLLYAIAGTVRKNNPDAKITYVKSEDFTNELIEAIRKGSLPDFREKYRTSDILLVDDIQFIAGKNSTQEEFFHTFNTLYESRKQIVLTSDRPPKEMAQLEDRLRTRFECGLMSDIEPPDFETRMAIISLKADLIGLSLTNEQKEFIANNVTANVRQLEGVVHKLLAFRDLLKENDVMKATEKAVLDIFAENPWINPTPEFIIKAVAKYYGVTYEDITGKDRSQKIIEPRKIAMYMVRTMTQQSLLKIGKVFNKDHSTVKHSIDTLEEQLKDDSALREKIQDVKNSVLTP